ncbi:MAG: hypothetical protein M3Q79_03535 [bacterium]|nr:hypothetical protein [bacterium]
MKWRLFLFPVVALLFMFVLLAEKASAESVWDTAGNPTFTSLEFDPNDDDYLPPSDLDAAYFCTTQEAIKNRFNYQGSAMYLTFSNGNKYQVTADEVGAFRAYKDIVSMIEAFYTENGAYPSIEYLRSKTGELGQDKELGDMILADTGARYLLLPEGCVNDCKDYDFAVGLGDELNLVRYSFDRESINP